MLLDTVNAMDTTFTLKDVFYIGGLLVVILSAWFKLNNDKEKIESTMQNEHKLIYKEIAILDTKHTDLEKKQQEEFMSATNGRRAIKKELLDKIDKDVQVTHQRIDRVRDENIKSYEKVEAKLEKVDTRLNELETLNNDNTNKILEAIKSKGK